jgi:hypothetical protein
MTEIKAALWQKGDRSMKTTQSGKLIAALTIGAIVLVGMFNGSPRVHADSDNEESLIKRGFEIAPVPLNLVGKNRALVGLGSYIMNAASDCNSCHNSGGPPDFDFVSGQNPYKFMPGTNLPQSKKVNPATYLGGGASFFTVNGETPGPDNPEIIARNLTPDWTGRPEGGHTLAEFKQIIRTGVDMDHAHPTLPAGYNGNVLQIMPWPTFQNMTDHYLEAIYEYLSAIPCLEGGPGEPPNRCHH